MTSPRESGTELDPARLEAGVRQLRALGYLQSPAEEYLTRRVGIRTTTARTAVAVGLWVGGALGSVGSILLMISAVLSEPTLLQRPGILFGLWVEILLVLVLAGAIATGLAAAAALSGRGRRRGFALARVEMLVVIAPALVSCLYLADRLGRAIGGEWGGYAWWSAALLVSAGVGAVGAAVAWSVSSAVALARMNVSTVERPFVLTRGQRLLPWLVFSGLALAFLAAGPYRGLDSLPNLDDVTPAVVAAPRPLFLITVDGVADPAAIGIEDARSLESAAEHSRHPAAFWNEIATGFGARDHGVIGADAAGLRGWEEGVGEMREDPLLGLLLRHLLPGVGLGETIATDRRDLRRPPVWEIAAVAGRRARAVNCWATYPAARREGLEIVSDRDFLRAYENGAERDSFVVWPPDIALDSLATWRDRLDAERKQMAGYGQGLRWLDDHARSDSVLHWIWDLATAADLHHLRRAVRELDTPIAPSLVVVHLNGLDMLRRSLARRPAVDPRPLVRAFEDFLSSALAAHQPPQSHARVVLGRAPVPERGAPVVWTAGSVTAPLEAAEWAAWLLWEQGILPAHDLRVPASIAPDELERERPATFGRLHLRALGAERSGADLERLRSLGYIGG